MWGKLLQIPLTDLFVIRHAIFFKPDLVIRFSGIHISHAGWLLKILSIVIDDTDHAKLTHASYKPFSKHILTPSCCYKEMGVKQIRFVHIWSYARCIPHILSRIYLYRAC